MRSKLSAQEQLAAIENLTRMDRTKITVAQLEPVFQAAQHPVSDEVQLKAAVLLSEVYPTLAAQDANFAKRTHTILLRDLRHPRDTMAHPSCSWLLMTHLREENLEHIPWRSAQEVTSAVECFYGYCESGRDAADSHRRVRDLVKFAGRHFARQGNWEEAFRLMEQVHIPPTIMDADLFWLRNSLVLYERRRIRRLRRLLYSFLCCSVLVVLAIGPMTFLQLENPERISSGRNPLSILDAEYWSCMTAFTVGYGDVVPVTTPGRMLAMIISFFGVMTIGVVAGLILGSITPRALP